MAGPRELDLCHRVGVFHGLEPDVASLLAKVDMVGDNLLLQQLAVAVEMWINLSAVDPRLSVRL